MTKADVARNGLHEEMKRTGLGATRRSFEQRARFLRKRNCALNSISSMVQIEDLIWRGLLRMPATLTLSANFGVR